MSEAAEYQVKFRVSRYADTKIEPVAILRETESYVWVKAYGRERREAKSSTYSTLYDTWEQAHQALVARATNKLETHKRGIESQEGVLAALRALAVAP